MSTMPPPGQGADAGSAGAGQGSPPANPQQVMLAQISQVLRRMAQENPTVSAGLQKAVQGIQEAQTAMLTGNSARPPEQNPPV